MPATRHADNVNVTPGWAKNTRAAAPRLQTRFVALSVLGAALLGLLVPVPPAGADNPAGAVAPAMDRLTEAIDKVVGAEAVTSEAFGQQREAHRVEAQAQAEVNRTRVVLDDQRARYGQLGAASYVLHGTSTTRDHQVMVAALAARKAMLEAATTAAKAAEESLIAAVADRERADQAFANAEAYRVASEAERSTQETAADQALAAAGALDLPSVAYVAYKRAADTANAAHPECRLSGAVLAGYGRVRWRHGRPTGPTADLVVVEPPAGDPRGPYDLERALGPVADRLCAGTASLDTFRPLQAAVFAVDGDSARVDIILAAARRYTMMPGVDLGTVPVDPVSPLAGVPQFDDGGPLLGIGDVTGMLDWAFTRVGTPYSQCLGPDARPQDPTCPPGTNRFGAGFFDCSGFVSHAYRKIGIIIPPTTDAQEADPTFMATKVADRMDPAVLRPGDIFLMDGHTGMYAGGGYIIHAVGKGLTLEPIPGWVAHSVFAVMRPVDPLFGPNPALLAP